MKKKFYPSKPKNKNEAKSYEGNSSYLKTSFENENSIDLYSLEIPAPFQVDHQKSNKVFNGWVQEFKNSWVNPMASINSNNAIGNLASFLLDRLSYAECASLSTDTIIHKAITTIRDEIFNKGGDFKIISDDESLDQDKVLEQLNEKLDQLEFWDNMRELVKTSLIYGTSFLYISTPAKNLELPLKNDFKGASISSEGIIGLKVLEPYGVGVSEVETSNLLSLKYMRPQKFFVGGSGGEIHASRLIQLSFFEVPNLIKPVFNYGGISLCQLMRDYVKDADSVRKSLVELFMRFRTMIIKTPFVNTNLMEAKKRAKAVGQQKNNLGVLLLSPEEEYLETITAITGLNQILSQMMETMVVSSGLPTTKLLGISPSGFNSTGEFDLVNYYDVISGYQNNLVKPVIEWIAQLVLFNLGIDAKVKFEFKPLQKLDEKEIADTKAVNVNNAVMMQGAGILSSEQTFDYLKELNVLSEKFKIEEETPLVFDNLE